MSHDVVSLLAHFIHKRLIWALTRSYAVAAVCPSLGLSMRDVSLWELHLFQANTRVSLPMLLLAFLLMNAGLGMQISPWRQWGRSIFILKCGVIGNLLIPLLFILFVSQVMRLWPNPDEVQNILVGLALVASMPVAGSSTAWS